jgi:hypothetical protein
MIRMRVRDDRALDRSPRISVEIARRAVQAGIGGDQQVGSPHTQILAGRRMDSAMPAADLTARIVRSALSSSVPVSGMNPVARAWRLPLTGSRGCVAPDDRTSGSSALIEQSYAFSAPRKNCSVISRVGIATCRWQVGD